MDFFGGDMVKTATAGVVGLVLAALTVVGLVQASSEKKPVASQSDVVIYGQR